MKTLLAIIKNENETNFVLLKLPPEHEVARCCEQGGTKPLEPNLAEKGWKQTPNQLFLESSDELGKRLLSAIYNNDDKEVEVLCPFDAPKPFGVDGVVQLHVGYDHQY